jgi:hypothetical protein
MILSLLLLGPPRRAGAKLFRHYQDLIYFGRRNPVSRGRHIDVIHTLGHNRMSTFTRLLETGRLLVGHLSRTLRLTTGRLLLSCQDLRSTGPGRNGHAQAK